MTQGTKETAAVWPDHYSQSSIKLYRACPGAWRDKYGLQKLQKVADPLIFGSVFHELSAVYDEVCVDRRAGTAEDAAGDVFDRVMSGHPEAVPQRQDLKNLFETFVVRHRVDFEHLVGIEKELSYEWGKLKFTGILDRVYLDSDEKTLTVRDLKTDGAIRSQADVDRDFQLSVYAMLAAEHYEWTGDVQVEMEFVRYGVLRGSVRTQKQIADIRDEITESIIVIQCDEEFAYEVGAHCSICGFADTCPKLKEVVEAKEKLVIVTGIDAANLATMMIAMETRLGQVKDLLKAYCSDHGNLYINGLEVGYHKTESVRYPMDALLEALKDSDYNALKLLSPDTTAIKKAVKRDEKLAGLLAPVAVDASSTRFTSQKIKE